MSEGALDAAYACCAARCREEDYDRWFGALFAPAPARKHLHALAAFNAETREVKARARDSALGEIRLMWWREALAGARDAEAQGNPVAAAMLRTIEECRLPTTQIEAHLAARRAELSVSGGPDPASVERTSGAALAAIVAMSAEALGGAADDLIDAAAITEALRDAAAGRSPDAVLLAAAAERRSRADAAARKGRSEAAPAFAAFACARLDLRRMRKGRSAPAPRWRRQIAIWRWMRRR